MIVRPKLTESESTLAFVAGGGLALVMLALLLSSARGSVGGAQTLDLMLGVGILLLVGGSIGWAFITKPWKNFDDWSTPLYTGHDDHAAHDEHTETHTELHTDEVHHEVAVLAVAPPPRIVEVPEVHAEAPTDEGHHGVAALTHLEPQPWVVEAVSEPVIEPGTLEPVPVTHVNPEQLSAEEKKADNLLIIDGIGPKIVGALNNAGIRTYADIATHNPADLEKIVRDAGVRMVGHADTWVQEAQLAAEGKIAELEQFKADLRANRSASSD